MYVGRPKTITVRKETVKKGIRAIPQSICKDVLDASRRALESFILRVEWRGQAKAKFDLDVLISSSDGSFI